MLTTALVSAKPSCVDCNRSDIGTVNTSTFPLHSCHAKLQELHLQPSPLDALIDALGGPGEVAEMTGRRGRLIRKNGVLKYDLRPENEETRCGQWARRWWTVPCLGCDAHRSSPDSGCRPVSMSIFLFVLMSCFVSSLFNLVHLMHDAGNSLMLGSWRVRS